MAMTILNNTSSLMTLGELNKNTTALGKQLKKISSGTKITGAGDGAAEYAISEKMRIRIRALNQNEENVQKGMSLLRVAEGGIQSQVELLKTVKQKVIDAANDTNTDIDRQTIQKEITQSYDQMEEIACEMDYNTQRVLLGDDFWKKVYSWDVKDKAEWVPDSDAMGVIPDVYDTLDAKTGPFDIFNDPGVQPADMTSLGITAAPQYFTGGIDGEPNIVTMDLSVYSSVDDLNNVGFSFEGRSFVLTQNPSNNYRGGTKIDISGCSSLSDVANAIASSLGDSVIASGSVVTLKTTHNDFASSSNAETVKGFTLEGGTKTTYSGGSKAVDIDREVHIHETASSTGLFTPDKYLSGGDDPFYNPYADADAAGSYAGKCATLSQNISSVPDNSGITLHGSGTSYVKFIPGTSGFSYDSDTRIWTVGKQANNATASICGMNVALSNGNMTFTASSPGSYGNNYYISDSYQYDYDESTHIHTPATPPTVSTTTYTAVTAMNTSGVINYQVGTDGTYAHFSMDVSSYADSTSQTDLEDMIQDLYSKAFMHDGYAYEFTDSAVLGLGTVSKVGGVQLDLNTVRQAVKKGETIGNALANLFEDKVQNAAFSRNGNGNVDTIVLRAHNIGERGNSETIYSREGSLRSYDIDYGKWFDENPDAVIPDDLYNKGFRAYCATCADQWFNFIFMPRTPEDMDERPESGTETEDIKTILIDVSQVTDASSLVQAIYDQATPILTGAVEPYLNSKVTYNHFMRVASNPETGILTIYDNRLHPVDDPAYYPEAQEKGAKIADGIFDNVLLSERDLYVKEVVIQDTDHASKNLRLLIPRTTMDHIFGFNPSNYSVKDYDVLTKNHRDKLLGQKNKNGILDKGIRYLLDAATLVGSQMQRLDNSNSNIVTANENTQASESTIRDADMAKEMVNYTKANVLSQASQSMLAQANQTAGNVLSLLQ